MNRRRISLTIAAMSLVLLSGLAGIRAADAPLSVIPQDALGFAVVNRLAATNVKVQLLLQQMKLPATNVLNLAKLTVGVKEGIDENGAAVIVVMPPEEGRSTPRPVILVPVTDYQKVLDQLTPDEDDDSLPAEQSTPDDDGDPSPIVEVTVAGERSLIANYKGYAVAVQPSDRALLEQILAGPAGSPADMAPLAKWLDEADVAVVVSHRGVQLLATLGQAGLEQVKTQLTELEVPDEMKENMKAVAAMYDVYGQILKTAGEEINDYAVAARIDDDGNVHFIERCRVMPGGEAAKIVGSIKPADYDLLGGLPSGPLVAAGAGVLPESLVEPLLDFSAQIMKAMPEMYGMDAAEIDKMMDVSRQSMKGLRGMSMMLLVGKPGDPIYSNIAAIERVDDAKAFMAEYRKTLAAMNELTQGKEGSIIGKMELKDVEIGGVPACQLTMTIPKVPTAAAVPNYDELMETFFGPGGKITAYFAAADEHTIVMAYTQQDLLQVCLDVVAGKKPGLAADPDLAKTAAMLPTGAQWVGYVSPKGTIDFVLRVIEAVAPDAMGAFRLPAFPQTPPIGVAVTAMPDGVTSHTVVPVEVIKGGAEFVTEIMQSFGAAAPAE